MNLDPAVGCSAVKGVNYYVEVTLTEPNGKQLDSSFLQSESYSPVARSVRRHAANLRRLVPTRAGVVCPDLAGAL